MFQKYGIPKRATCKSATSPDQIWLSPEVVPLVQNVAFWNIFPDHQVLIAGLFFPPVRVVEPQWRLPGHIPWEKVHQDQWISSPDWGPLFQSNPSHVVRAGLATVPSGEIPGSQHSATLDFRRWSASFEEQVSKCVATSVGRHDRSFFGRGSITRPKPRRTHAPVIKPPRPGELAPASGFLNRSVAAWYKQMRRLQSYCHAVNHPGLGTLISLGLPCGILSGVLLVFVVVSLFGGHIGLIKTKVLLAPCLSFLPVRALHNWSLMTLFKTTGIMSIGNSSVVGKAAETK